MSSNRTFMELKLFMYLFLYLIIDRSNRTFMELKYGNQPRSRYEGEF